MEKSGFTISKSETVDAPIINELPLALECTLDHIDEESGCVYGNITNIVADEAILDEYVAYLKELGISYIFAGRSDLDCAVCMGKLKEIFRIERLMIAGGGYIDWAFADAGMIDELSLVVAPCADGEDRVTVFEKSEKSHNDSIAFMLKDVQKLEGNAVWLRYGFHNAK